ncbi:MAG: response regulator transcription factor [Caulobacteraceae bacterium]|nr:response regulator transcription factor [Caulobacteraceae bacterium]
MSPTILIVDDHELTARALRLRICAAIPHCDVVIAPTLVSAMQQAIRLRRLSLVLLDLMLPDARGYSGLLLMRQLTRGAPIALISARQDQATIAKARSLGAAGFLSKSLSPLAMTDAVCAMLRGDTAFPEQVDEDDQTTILREQLDRLSAAELRVLISSMDGRLHKQVAADMGLSEATVKGHMSAVIRKLGVPSRLDALMLARPILAGTGELLAA